MKEELKKRDYEYVDDIKFEDQELFWVPVRRYNEEEGVMKDAGKI